VPAESRGGRGQEDLLRRRERERLEALLDELRFLLRLLPASEPLLLEELERRPILRLPLLWPLCRRTAAEQDPVHSVSRAGAKNIFCTTRLKIKD
jgi:hypothetical protein